MCALVAWVVKALCRMSMNSRSPPFSCKFKGGDSPNPKPVSSPQNPLSEPLAPPSRATQLDSPPSPSPARPPVEDPPWTGWEVSALAVLSLFTIVVSVLATAYVVHARFSPGLPWWESVKRPEVMVGGQFLAYVLLFLLMYALVRNHTDGRVLDAIRWNWPQRWTSYLLAGIALEVCLLPFAILLPMPKNLPLDEFFRTARDAYILSVFGILFAPLFEELFFRGFLYPVLARRLGMGPSIFLTALGFAVIHAAQLKYSWGPLLVIFLVGLAFTAVRAIKKSVAATVLMHMAYNATIFIVTFIATSGFRHMEKFNR